MTEFKRLVEHGYTIRQTAKIYGVTVDTLYYYERQGLVVPKRNPINGYRLYGPEDFARLNVIRALRSLDFDLNQIRSYLENRSFKSTVEIIDDEIASIDKQTEYLSSIKRGLLESLQKYTWAMTAVSHPSTEIRREPVRHCALVSDELVKYEDIPYAFARYTADHHEKLQVLNTLNCYRVDTSRTFKGCFPAKAILLYCQDPSFKGDYDLPAGDYACFTFSGNFSRCKEIYDRMVGDLSCMGYEESGDPLEFCLIGEYESDDFDEYVSRIEIPVRPKKGLEENRNHQAGKPRAGLADHAGSGRA